MTNKERIAEWKQELVKTEQRLKESTDPDKQVRLLRTKWNIRKRLYDLSDNS